jgi:TatD DNase family protein
VEYFDVHNHLQHAWLAPYRSSIVAELERQGISGAVVNGTTEQDWSEVAALAAAHAWVYPSFGLHPWFVAQRTKQWRENLRQRLDLGPCALGEIGLDRWQEPYDLEDQSEVFRWQLRLAAERNLPVTVHCLKAWGPLLDILRTEALPRKGFLLHAYGGAPEMIFELVELGAYFSFSGYFLHPRKTAIRAMFAQIPLERLMVETDAPSMPLPVDAIRFPLPEAPEGEPINHPANLFTIYEALARIRQMSVGDLAESVGQNFRRLFGR